MSFSAEINDFIGGVKTGYSIGSDAQDRKLAKEKWEFEKGFKEKSYSDASARAARAEGRANRSLDLREKGYNDRRADYEARKAEYKTSKAEAARARSANAALPGTADTSADTDTFYAGFGPPDAPEYDGADDQDSFESDVGGDEILQPGSYSRGGPVLHAAGGALVGARAVDEEEGLDNPAEEATEAVPTETPQPATAAPVDPTVNREAKGDPLFKQVANVTRDVMDEWNKESTEKKGAIDTEPSKSQDRISDVKPASHEEIKAIDAKIDPEGKMEPYRKGAARLVDAYSFFVEKGDVTKARKIAGQILKYNQMISMAGGRLAMESLKQGDLQSASKLFSDAYDNIPDGGKLETEVTPNNTVLFKIDKQGAAVRQGEITAKQLWGLAAKVADGSEFLNQMSQVAAMGSPSSATSTSNDGGNGGKKTKFSYRDVVSKAAQAIKEYESLSDQYESAADESQKKALYGSMKEARSAALKAKDLAIYGATATGRKPDAAEKDIAAAIKNSLEALPTDPNAPADAPAEEGSSWWNPSVLSEGVNQAINATIPGGGDWFGIQARKKAQQGTPAQAEGQPAIEAQKAVGDKTYVKIGGKWFEQN